MPKGNAPGAAGAGPTALDGRESQFDTRRSRAVALGASQDPKELRPVPEAPALPHSAEPLRRLQAELEQAEAADDERRLQVLEDLHRTLEGELDEAGSARP